MQIINFTFGSPSASINDEKMSIRPLHVCTLDEVDQTITLDYSVSTPGVKVRILTPQNVHKLEGSFQSFRKEISFEQTSSGKKKDFTLLATARLGNSFLTTQLEIKYS